MVELISIHIPKTAGESFRVLLPPNYDTVHFDYGDNILDPKSPFRSDFNNWYAAQVERAGPLEQGTRAVHGHFWLGKYAGRFPGARKIMWLRDPAARLISHYFYWKSKPPDTHSIWRKLLEEDLSLLEFAELPELRNIVSDVYIRGFTHSDFDFIGIQDFYDSELNRVADLLKWKELTRDTINKTMNKDYEEFVPEPSLLSRIRELNQRDMDLYEIALKMRSQFKSVSYHT